MKKILVLLLMLFCASQCTFAKAAKLVIPEGSGYVGTLPDVTERFQKSEPQDARPSSSYKNNFDTQDDIKPAPRDNPAFVNIIMKKDKTSQYINDLNDLISIIEQLQTVIEDKDGVQRFNAESYYLGKNVEYFRDKYKNKAESSYVSFKKVTQLNTHVQTISQLRLDSEVYTPYVTAEQSGNMFSQNSIDTQLGYLLDEIKSTLVVLKEAR